MKKFLFAVVAVAGCAAAANADIWNESGDAGPLGQITIGNGALTSIVGVLEGANRTLPDFEDAFVIRISDPLNFRATTVGGATLDTQLFLFDSLGNGVAFNDDSVGLQSTLTSGFTAARPAGIYILAVSGYDRDAVDAGGLEIFADSPFGSERGPTAGRGALTNWTGSGSAIGSYSIVLLGAEFAQSVPTPGSAALAGLGCIAAFKRRRR